MKRHPLQTIGTVFAIIACIEAAVLLILLITVRDPMALSVAGGVLSLQCLVFGGIGFGFLAHVKKQRVNRERLIANGYYEMGSVVCTQRVQSVRINNRHPYRVICRVERGDVCHEYRSEMLMNDPGLQPGDPIPVYLDLQDDKRCYVDVESAVLALTPS